MNDSEVLIDGLRRGEKNAFEAVYKEYYSMLYHICFQYIGNTEDAKNVVQDAYLKFWENREKLQPNSNLKNLLYTITKNNCLNHLQREQLFSKYYSNIKYVEMRFNYEALNHTAAEYMEFEQLKEKIETAINNLPERCRQIFNMSRFEELKNREIADKLGITTKAVEAQITSALKKLHSELRDYLPVIFLITRLLS